MINRDLIRLKVVQLIYAFYQNEGKSLDVAEKELIFSMDKAYDLYHYLLTILVEMRKMAERKEETRIARCQRLGTKTEGIFPEKMFAENQFLLQLEANKQLTTYREEQKKDWIEEETFIKKLYTTFVESEVYQLYLTKEDFNYETDREVIRKLYKTYICNNEDFDSLLEEHSLYWNDDKDIIDSFVLKTIKRFDPAAGEEQELLPQFSVEEDCDFALTLFRATIEQEQEIRNIIRENCKNWEFNRLAFMDVIIMQIAMAEILNFPSIPLKVSINEYLDIAKIYSTPRSASYINGLIDHSIKKLQNDNKLLKS
jgi:N utilization substance protein B